MTPDVFTAATPSYRRAVRTCDRAGVAFEITDRSTDWRRAAVLAAVLFVLAQVARVAFALPAYLQAGAQ